MTEDTQVITVPPQRHNGIGGNFMSNDETLGGLIDHRISYLIDQLPANQEVTVTGVYDGNFVDVQPGNRDEILTYIPTNTPGKIGDEGVLIFLNGDINNPFVMLNIPQVDEAIILALGVGLFHINDEGHLIVELPMGVENPFHIDDNGHLIVELPDGASNDYRLNGTDGHLYYNR